ncbi:phosphoribosylformylglycinamidine synthase, purS protein [Candidatus Kaiserbacteria bacterium RIFCSPHIGHO2_01_FULL_56_24]|uniref:Phosphoribosylformylglycinamidine synthase subunit PurS n=1 Tax=Candidatus Kaiserbacteria bacterium RIFCSPHIGHO2_01_FULL_56_24 TaxID=1798487 RepID=A0A1F6DAN9_9BACT|nr:MAG: phosphoribosylformylglycinamidine synthase, purS protein [Candidatus Kaiserbacteria bacterium RIFCSPHIGHO2_01_FULL_56_24]
MILTSYSEDTMETYKGVILIQSMSGVNEPEANAILQHLKTTMGYPEVKSVNCGKRFVIELDAESEESARSNVENMAKKLFANLTYQTYEVTVTKKALWQRLSRATISP